MASSSHPDESIDFDVLQQTIEENPNNFSPAFRGFFFRHLPVWKESPEDFFENRDSRFTIELSRLRSFLRKIPSWESVWKKIERPQILDVENSIYFVSARRLSVLAIQQQLLPNLQSEFPFEPTNVQSLSVSMLGGHKFSLSRNQIPLNVVLEFPVPEYYREKLKAFPPLDQRQSNVFFFIQLPGAGKTRTIRDLAPDRPLIYLDFSNRVDLGFTFQSKLLQVFWEEYCRLCSVKKGDHLHLWTQMLELLIHFAISIYIRAFDFTSCHLPAFFCAQYLMIESGPEILKSLIEKSDHLFLENKPWPVEWKAVWNSQIEQHSDLVIAYDEAQVLVILNQIHQLATENFTKAPYNYGLYLICDRLASEYGSILQIIAGTTLRLADVLDSSTESPIKHLNWAFAIPLTPLNKHDICTILQSFEVEAEEASFIAHRWIGRPRPFFEHLIYSLIDCRLKHGPAAFPEIEQEAFKIAIGTSLARLNRNVKNTELFERVVLQLFFGNLHKAVETFNHDQTISLIDQGVLFLRDSSGILFETIAIDALHRWGFGENTQYGQDVVLIQIQKMIHDATLRPKLELGLIWELYLARRLLTDASLILPPGYVFSARFIRNPTPEYSFIRFLEEQDQTVIFLPEDIAGPDLCFFASHQSEICLVSIQVKCYLGSTLSGCDLEHAIRTTLPQYFYLKRDGTPWPLHLSSFELLSRLRPNAISILALNSECQLSSRYSTIVSTLVPSDQRHLKWQVALPVSDFRPLIDINRSDLASIPHFPKDENILKILGIERRMAFFSSAEEFENYWDSQELTRGQRNSNRALERAVCWPLEVIPNALKIHRNNVIFFLYHRTYPLSFLIFDHLFSSLLQEVSVSSDDGYREWRKPKSVFLRDSYQSFLDCRKEGELFSVDHQVVWTANLPTQQEFLQLGEAAFIPPEFASTRINRNTNRRLTPTSSSRSSSSSTQPATDPKSPETIFPSPLLDPISHFQSAPRSSSRLDFAALLSDDSIDPIPQSSAELTSHQPKRSAPSVLHSPGSSKKPWTPPSPLLPGQRKMDQYLKLPHKDPSES